MNLTQRQSALLAMVRERSSMRVQDLARHLDVSLETIRRDVKPLVEAGELRKSHGAVSAEPTQAEAPFERRMRELAREKRYIAAHVARSIEDGDSVMMDTGTTTSILARELLSRHGLTIVTNSSDVARTLATVNGNKVYMAGGELHGDNGAAFGRSAIEFIRHFRVTHAIISIGAIDARLGLSDYHLSEAEFAATVLTCGHRRVVITDHTKFSRSALVRVAGFEDFDVLVSDAEPPTDIADKLAAAGIMFELALP